MPLICKVCANILLTCRSKSIPRAIRASPEEREFILITSTVPEHGGAAVLHSQAAVRFQDMQIGFGKLHSLANSPTGALGRGMLWVGGLRLSVPTPVSHSQQGCTGEIGKDLAWRLGSQSSLLCHQPLCNPLALPAKGVGRNPHRWVLLRVQLSLGNSSALAPKHGRALWAPSFAPRWAAHAPASHSPAAAARRRGVGPLHALCAFRDGTEQPDQAGGRQGQFYTSELFWSHAQP